METRDTWDPNNERLSEAHLIDTPYSSVLEQTVEPLTLDGLPELLTRRQLAAFTGIAEQTLARWAVAGAVNRGPQITRLGRAARYQKKHVQQWLDANTEPRPARPALAG